MSIYNSSYSGANDNERTRRAKTKLERIVREQMLVRGFKTWIKTEVPATFLDPRPVAYHLDLGVLFRSKTEFDFYHFFAVELDDSGHATFRHENKDKLRDEAFFTNKGIVTCRVPIDKIFEEQRDESRFFDKYIYDYIMDAYIIMPAAMVKQQLWAEINRNFAIQLKENSSTQCSKCDHKAAFHTLTGCHWRHTNKAKMVCHCTNPYFVSDG